MAAVACDGQLRTEAARHTLRNPACPYRLAVKQEPVTSTAAGSPRGGPEAGYYVDPDDVVDVIVRALWGVVRHAADAEGSLAARHAFKAGEGAAAAAPTVPGQELVQALDGAATAAAAALVFLVTHSRVSHGVAVALRLGPKLEGMVPGIRSPALKRHLGELRQLLMGPSSAPARRDGAARGASPPTTTRGDSSSRSPQSVPLGVSPQQQQQQQPAYSSPAYRQHAPSAPSPLGVGSYDDDDRF